METIKSFNKADRGFFWCSKSRYALPDDAPQIMFGIYPDGGDEGTEGEMGMQWHSVNGDKFPGLQCFDDAFAVLLSFGDVIYELAQLDSTNFTEEQFVQILLKCGFIDRTNYPFSPEGGI